MRPVTSLMGATLWLALTFPVVAATSGPASPLTLGEVVHLALDRHISVQASQHMLRAAEAQRREASSRYWPSIGLETGPSYSHMPGSGIASFPGVGGMVGFPSSGTVVDTTLSLRQTIFDSFATQDAVRMAELGVELGQQQLKQTEQDTMLSAALAYFQVLRAEGLRRVAAEDHEQNEEHLRLGQSRVEAGTATLMDVLQLKAIASNSRVALLQSQNAVEIARLSLSNAINQPVENRALVTPQALGLPGTGNAAQLASVFPERPDYQQALLRTKQSETRASLEGRGLWPTLAASSRYSQRDTNQGILSAGVTVNWNVFDAMRVKSRIEASESEAEASRLQLQLTKETIELELQRGVKTRDEARSRTVALKEGLQAAQEAYRLAKSRYALGMATQLELRDVQTTLVQTENRLLQAETDWREAEVRLARAMGVDLSRILGR